ncbi:hypothetical protein NE237_006432 [Protea cynaroides]|uniref:RWP-RK domain-containing protein n=1 Tax=Protea cynaroides TaxID=273540 RepID=A0A9Q0QVA9_9MAGN|nr:hypothetical protein NE237_006432 [Protea cynaroides]
MDNQSLRSWSGYEMVAYQEDPFIFLEQLYPPDFSGYNTPLSWQWEFPIKDGMFDAIPLMESFIPTDTVMESFSTSQAAEVSTDGSSVKCEPHEETVPYKNASGGCGKDPMKEKKAKRCKEERKSSSNELTRNTVSSYFYMPITQAAKELNVGLTQLKKRCRELGIGRWPHRKLMSLQTLIKNVQEWEQKEGEVTEATLKNAIELLEQEKKLMEVMPDIQLGENTKKLRQACFKSNYKKKKFMGMVEVDLDSSVTMEPYLQLQGQRERGKRVKHEFFP